MLPSRWPNLAAPIVASLACIAAFAWVLSRFVPRASDAALAVLAFCLPAILVLAGLIVTFYPPQSRRKGVWLGACGVILALNWLVLHEQATRNAAAQAKAGRETAEWQGKATQLQKQILDNQTGGESFAYVMPQVVAGLETVPLQICSRGGVLLSDVVVSLNRDSDFRDPKRKPAIYTPQQAGPYSLAPGQCRPMRETIEPRLEPGRGEELWILTVAANNGRVDQTIRFRRGKSRPWEFQMDVRKRQLTHAGGTQHLKLYRVLGTDWSNAEAEMSARVRLVE